MVLNFTPYAKGDLDVYGLAYREAADNLVEAFRSRRGYSDADACPIVFLYRQAVELYVKAIVLWGSGLVRLQSGEELNADKLLTTHEFSKLLPAMRRVFKDELASPNNKWTIRHLDQMQRVFLHLKR